MQNKIISLTNITKVFTLGADVIHALKDINLTIHQGDFLTICGPSGSGKSTLLNMLGLIDAPTSGQISFLNQDTKQLSDNQLSDLRAHKIGYIFQNFNLIPVLNVLENVMLMLGIRQISPVEAKERSLAMIDAVGLSKFKNFRPDQLSGGQKQRVAIARALVGEPELVIADEPTANLDSVISRELIHLLSELNTKTGVTCVFSTHDPRLISIIDHRIEIEDGMITHNNSSRTGSAS